MQAAIRPFSISPCPDLEHTMEELRPVGDQLAQCNDDLLLDDSLPDVVLLAPVKDDVRDLGRVQGSQDQLLLVAEDTDGDLG